MKINALAFALAALAGTASARLEVKSKLADLNGDEPTSKLRGGNFALEVKSKQTGLNDGGDPLHRAGGRPTSFGSIVNCTQATTTAGERSAPLMLPTCVQMQMHVRTDKTTAVSRTARRTEVFGHARDSR